MNKKYLIIILIVLVIGALFYFLVVAAMDSALTGKTDTVGTSEQQVDISSDDTEANPTFKKEKKEYDVFKPERRSDETDKINTRTEDMLM